MPINQHASPAAYAMIREFESLATQCYLCPAGIPTNGYGHTGPDIKPGMPPVTEAKAESWLRDDVAKCEVAINAAVHVALTQGQYDALTSFVFNLGGASLKASTLLRLLNRGDYVAAAAQFERWIHAKDKTGKLVALEGLKRRRAAEKRLFLS